MTKNLRGMKILFISTNCSDNGGGAVITKRNLDVLKEIAGTNNVLVITIEKQKTKLSDVVDRCTKHYVVGLNSSLVKKIIQISKDFDIIWIDGSFWGRLAKELKHNGYQGRIITFFHNVEKYFRKRNFFQTLMYPLYNRPIIKSEIEGIVYSDNLIALTKRDANYIKKIKSNSSITILPSSIKDSFISDKETQKNSSEKSLLKLLFVGSYFYANVNGLTWFIKNVIPKINVELTIVGSNMDRLPFHSIKNIHIYGFVPDLGVFYRNCDAIISPIFEGSGMKTKTTEALMWGKYIIGSHEAFVGFTIPQGLYKECNTVDEFINGINMLSNNKPPKFIKEVRDLYLKKYSFNNSVDIIKRMLNL